MDGSNKLWDHINDLNLDHHVTYNNAGFGISQLKPTGGTVDVRVSAYNEATEPHGAYSGTEITNDTPLDIVSITVRSAPGTGQESHTFTGDSSFSIGGRSISVDFNPSTSPGGPYANDGAHDFFVDVTNLGENYQVLINTANGFERMLVEDSGQTNEGFDISGIIVSQQNAGNPIDMTFDLKLFDGDGDSTTMLDLLGVTLTTPDVFL